MKPFAWVPAVAALLLMTVLPAASAETRPHGVWPLRPRPAVVRTFDPPDVLWGSGHRGVDLQGVAGQPVRAALPGRVSFAGRIAGVAVVVVDHGPTRTTYQPVAGRSPVGTTVAAGAVIGVLEWHGSHCRPAACLHWGLIRGDTYLDPLTLVDGPSPVRLFPVGSGAVVPTLLGPSRPAPLRTVGLRPIVAGPIVAGPIVAGPIVAGPIVPGPIVPGLTPWG